MKKTMLWLAAGSLVLVLSACGQKKAAEAPITVQNGSVEVTQPNKPAGGIVNSIQDAFASGKKMQCSYTKTVGGSTESDYTMFIDGKNFKTQLTINNEGQTSVMDSIFLTADGGTVYSWAEGQKIGTKFTVDCMKEAVKDLPQAQQDPKTVAPDEAYKDAANVKCTPADNVDLTIPSDVNFTDQCETMKSITNNLPKNIPNIPKNIPVPGNIPTP